MAPFFIKIINAKKFYWAITKRQLKINEIRHDLIAGSVDIIVGHKFFCTTSNSKSATLLFEMTVVVPLYSNTFSTKIKQ
jgi:hypothetical protein